MNLTIPDELLEKNHLSSQTIKQEISLFLFDRFHLSLEQATQIAEIPLLEFNRLVEKYQQPTKKFSKLNNLKNRNCVIGNSDDLIHNDWSDEWKISI
jgi:predicted HTH domain antitoxin